MFIKNKQYNYNRTKKLLNNTTMTFILNCDNLKSSDINLLQEVLLQNQVKHYKPKNNLAKKVLKDSVFLNIEFLLKGLVILVQPNKISNTVGIDIFNPSKLDKSLNLMCLVINNNVYSTNEVKSLNSSCYKKTINSFCTSLLFTMKRNIPRRFT